MKRLAAGLLCVAAILATGRPSSSDASGHARGCHSHRCDRAAREHHRDRVRASWALATRRYGIPTLRARMRCESGNDGGYELGTTGNGFWFAHQFQARAWTGAGGRSRMGRPVGVWTRQPTRLEQDYRAVRWDHLSAGDPWPNCP